MKRNLLVLVTMFAAAACGSSDSTATLSWSVVAGTSASDCGDTTWEVHVTSSRPGSADRVDLFDCTDHGGKIHLPTGTWTISVAMYDKNGQALTLTAQQTVQVSGDISIGNFQFTFGAFDLTWMFTKGGSRVSCAQISGADTVRVTSTGGGRTFIDDFNCEDEGGATGPVPEGTYAVTLDLLDSGGHKLNLATPQVNAQAVSGQDTTIPNVVFAF